MSCSHLVPAKNIHAFYSTVQNTLTVTAEVTFGPGNFDIQICRSLIDPAVSPTPAFVVSAPAPTGVQPDYVVVRTISASFPLAKPPKTILVYAAGVDGPSKTEVNVADTPAAAAPAAGAAAPGNAAKAPAGNAAPITVTGWSRSFHYDDALADAVRQLRDAVGVVNPDVGTNATVIETGVAVGGFRVHTGLYVTLKTS
jgi:hypothetical protein